MSGTEIITFDGHHISFKGDCSYLLAYDSKDRNFSLIANVKDGKLESLTLADSQDMITIKAFKKVNTYNNLYR